MPSVKSYEKWLRAGMSLKWLLQPVLLLNFCEGLALPPWAFYGKKRDCIASVNGRL